MSYEFYKSSKRGRVVHVASSLKRVGEWTLCARWLEGDRAIVVTEPSTMPFCSSCLGVLAVAIHECNEEADELEYNYKNELGLIEERRDEYENALAAAQSYGRGEAW